MLKADDPYAVQSLANYEHRLARSMAGLANILDFDVILLGRGISNIATSYAGLSELIAQYAFSDGIKTRVVQATHGDASGVRGAAWL